jgi:putative lipoprotein (rSAM/lipoprotein system)
MKKKRIKFFDKIIVTLLGFLGLLNSCNNNTQTCEYGTPHGEFELSGVITDTEANPIKRIQVVSVSRYPDTIYTNNEGKYEIKRDYLDLENNTFHLKLEDIDGEENGGDFGSKEIEVKVTENDRVEKGSGWYKGKFVKTQDIELDRKNP